MILPRISRRYADNNTTIILGATWLLLPLHPLSTEPNTPTPDGDKPKAKSEWNYHPPIPIDNNPLFSWPIRWKDALIYYRDSWLVLSEGTIFVLLAVLSWHLFSPDMATAQSLHWSWVGSIWLRNFLILLVVAGLLHYYFFARKTARHRAEICFVLYV